ncbi:MAG: zinc-binding alcohol dehydrogenase family protein [Coraliomargaritaceae bacterium]
MKSLRLVHPGKFELTEMDQPLPGVGDALVRVHRCGVCGTDLHAFSGRQPFFSYPRRLGHELCVEVVSAPSGCDLSAGDLCAIEPYFSCGNCPACAIGKTNCCKNLEVLGVHIDGGHQHFLTIQPRYLHKSSLLKPDQLALVEPLAIGAHAVERASPREAEPTVILGMGPIGLAVALAVNALHNSPNVVLVDIDDSRLHFASETLGLGYPLKADENLPSKLNSYFGQLPSCVVDATGNRESMRHCFHFTEHGGRVVFVGLFVGDLQIDDPNFHRRELTLLASRAALSSTFASIIKQIESDSMNPLPIITHRLKFDQLDEKFPSLLEQPTLVKAMIDFC